MTSKALNKYSPAVHNGYWNARSCFKISLVMFLLHLLGFPVVFISMMRNILDHTDSDPSEGALYIAIGATCVAGAMGVIVALINFRYLFSKNQVDMSLSAPLSMKQRFLSDYFSGLASYILPFLAVQILSVILLLVGIIGFDGHEFTLIQGSGENEVITTYTCTAFSELFLPIYGRLFFGGILLMIMLYTLTVIITVCCGTLFETIVHTVLINVFIPLFIVTFYTTVFIDRFALYLVRPFLHILSWTSPAGGLIALGMGLGYENIYDYGSVPIASFAAGVIIFTAALFAGAYFLYKKRRAEQVSKPVVFRGVYAVMITLILFTAELLCFGPDMDEIKKFDKYFFGVLVSSFGIYMLFEIISNRGFKKIWKGAVRYAATLAVFAVCLAVINTTRCFGMEFKVPSADNVEKVYLGYGGVYYEYPDYQFFYYGGDGSDKGVYVIEDRNNIENIVNAHKDMVSAYKEIVDKDKGTEFVSMTDAFNNAEIPYSSNMFSVCYELKNGSRLTRYFPVMTAEAVKCLMQVEISEEYKTQAAEMIKDAFYPYDELCRDMAVSAERPENKDANVYLYVSAPKKTAVYSYTAEVRSETLVDEEFYYELRDALAKDIADRTAEEYFTPCSDRMYYMYISGVIYHDIDGSFTETLKVLAAHGCLNGIDADIDYILDEDNYIDGSLPNLTISLQQNMFENSAARAMYCQKENISNTDYWNYYATAPGRYVIHYSDELAEIFNVMQAWYITDEPCYTITVNGNRYTIPPEYSNIAEKVYLSGVDPSEYGENVTFYYGVGAAANN